MTGRKGDALAMSTSNGSDKTFVLVAEDSRIQAQILAKKLVEAGWLPRFLEPSRALAGK